MNNEEKLQITTNLEKALTRKVFSMTCHTIVKSWVPQAQSRGDKNLLIN